MGVEKPLGKMVNHALVKVPAAESHVAVGGHCTEAVALDLQNGDVEGSTTKVVHEDPLACAIGF